MSRSDIDDKLEKTRRQARQYMLQLKARMPEMAMGGLARVCSFADSDTQEKEEEGRKLEMQYASRLLDVKAAMVEDSGKVQDERQVSEEVSANAAMKEAVSRPGDLNKKVSEYLSALKAGAASALRAFGSAPTAPQKLVSAHRIALVKAAHSLVDAVQIAFDKLAEWSLMESDASWLKARATEQRALEKQKTTSLMDEVLIKEKAFNEVKAELAEVESKAANDDETVAAFLANEKM